MAQALKLSTDTAFTHSTITADECPPFFWFLLDFTSPWWLGLQGSDWKAESLNPATVKLVLLGA